MARFNEKESLFESFEKAANLIAKSVGSTLGPKGRNVLIGDKDNVIITKDGVTVSRNLRIENDEFANHALTVLKQAAERTNTEAGDGTTTTSVLASSLIIESKKHIQSGASPIEIKRGFDKAADIVLEQIKTRSKPIKTLKDIESIATISANGDKAIGKLICDAIDKAGKNGVVSIRESRTNETFLKVEEGLMLNTGYLAQVFVNSQDNKSCNVIEPIIFVCDEPILNGNQIRTVLERAEQANKPLVVVAERFEQEALAQFILNWMRGTMKVLPIAAPFYGEKRKQILSDLALITGATFFSKEYGKNIQDFTAKDFGSCGIVEVTKNQTVFFDGKGKQEKIDQAIEELKQEIINSSIEDAEKYQERLMRLASAASVIYIGGSSDVEVKEKRHRIEDALEAVNSARTLGIVPGGGVTLYRIREDLIKNPPKGFTESEELGIRIFVNCLESPFFCICKNAGVNPFTIISKLLDEEENVYNFSIDEVVNAFESGVVDPAKVLYCSVKNASSVAGTLITTGFSISV
jgi:chaperonin GroEL